LGELQILFKADGDVLSDTVLTCRYVHKKRNVVWQEAYSNIMKKVQDMMLVVYGAKLKLKNTFT